MTLSVDNPIELLHRDFPVDVLAQDLDAHPELWNAHTLRTDQGGPHHYVSDIWVRCLDWTVMRTDPTRFNAPHVSVWYPSAEQLPALKTAVLGVADLMGGGELGGVLVTKIPAGCCVMPHKDIAWHAQNYRKFAVSVRANQYQEFCFDKKRITTRPGDLFTFDNQYEHFVTNPSFDARITLIVCLRQES